MRKTRRQWDSNATGDRANIGVWIVVGFIFGGLFGFGAISGDALAVKNIFGSRDTLVFFGCPILGIGIAWLICSARSHKKRESRDSQGCSVGCPLMPALACLALAAGMAIPVIVLAIDFAREGQPIEGKVTDFRTKVFDEGD